MLTSKTPPAANQQDCIRCGRTLPPGIRDCKLCDLAYEAIEEFWQVVVRRFPEAKYGDLSPERTIRLHTAATDAIEEWISNNVPNQDDERTP